MATTLEELSRMLEDALRESRAMHFEMRAACEAIAAGRPIDWAATDAELRLQGLPTIEDPLVSAAATLIRPASA